MKSEQTPHLIDPAHVQYGTIASETSLHMTGGIRALQAEKGWFISPFPEASGAPTRAVGPVPESNIRNICSKLEVSLLGGDQVSHSDPFLPTRIWTPLLGLPRLIFDQQPADTWGGIAIAANEAGDDDYAMLARAVSASLRAAGIRVRDASDCYRAQLVSAMTRFVKPGHMFKNLALLDLYLAFHSLLSEMASARDYLATVAARRVGAPGKIDALNRLAEWVAKPSNSAHAVDPLVSALLSVWEENNTDQWLHDLTAYRNLFLHREPLGTGRHRSGLCIAERSTPWGQFFVLHFELAAVSPTSSAMDALDRFSDLHMRLCRLSDFAATQAKYEPKKPHFEVRRAP